MAKVNLKLVKKLINELEKSLIVAEQMQSSSDKVAVEDYIVELAKGSGLAAGIMQEGAMLGMDIANLMNKVSGGSPAGKAPTKEDLIESYLGPLKGGFKGGAGSKSGN